MELVEALAILRDEGPADVSDLCYHEAAKLLLMTGSVTSLAEAEVRVGKAVRSGAGLAKLAEAIEAQGGDPRQIEHPELLPVAPVV